jgi:hypothetical protein
MSYSLSLFAGAGWQFFDNNGTILSGGKLYTYSAGTTSPLATYTSSTAVTLNPNPIILDSAGRVPAEVWVNSSSIAKFVLKDSTDVLIGTWDNIPSLVSSLNLTGTNNGVVYFNSVGTFSSGSNLTFDGTNLGVAGAATVGTNLNVAGASALTGNTTVGGTLNVTGATTLSGALNVVGNVTGTMNVTGTLNASGATTTTGSFTTSGTTTLATGSTLNTSPASTDNSTKIATTAYVKTATLGGGQTWQDVTSTSPGPRASGTTYYNTTSNPIAVIVSQSISGDFDVTVDAVQIIDSYSWGNFSDPDNRVACTFIVPVGSSYVVTASIQKWVELR